MTLTLCHTSTASRIGRECSQKEHANPRYETRRFPSVLLSAFKAIQHSVTRTLSASPSPDGDADSAG
jgi:hypothetical protein